MDRRGFLKRLAALGLVVPAAELVARRYFFGPWQPSLTRWGYEGPNRVFIPALRVADVDYVLLNSGMSREQLVEQKRQFDALVALHREQVERVSIPQWTLADLVDRSYEADMNVGRVIQFSPGRRPRLIW